MVNRLILLFIGLLVYGRSFSQDEPKVFVGSLIAGANFTQVDGDSYSGYHKVGLNAGAQVCAHLTRSFGISLELLYSQKGSRNVSVYDSYTLGTYIEKYNMTLNYAEVPLMFHGLDRKYDYEAGVSFGYLIKASEWVLSDRPVIIDPVANRFENIDLNYVIGASRKFYKNWWINARFQYSIISIRPTDRIPVGYSYGNKGQFNNLLNLRLVRNL